MDGSEAILADDLGEEMQRRTVSRQGGYGMSGHIGLTPSSPAI